MSPARAAPSAAPANALRCWADHRSIYVELPSPKGPTILAFTLSEGGLSKALALIAGTRYDFGGTASMTAPSTLRQAMAQSILRQRGIIR